MFAYCNNNPVLFTDATGQLSVLAIDFLDEWINGDGSDKYYDEEDEISKKLKKKTKDVVKEAIEKYELGVSKDEWNHGTLYFGKPDSLDLWLAVRRCEYNLDIVEEHRTLDFCFFKIELVRYETTVTFHDTYDFTEQPWDNAGNYLNNYAMYAHDIFGIGKDYDWYATFTYKSSWEKAG